MDFESQSYGKWILAGEHTVLRGGRALVFPLKTRDFKLSYKLGSEPLKVTFEGPYAEDLRLLFWSTIEQALDQVQKARSQLVGQANIECQLPLGAGLGASAALCVLIARWWQFLGWIKSSAIYDFSRNLENLFHGESSGVDIAASMSASGIRFSRSGERSPIVISWKPKWFLSYSGQRGVTAECIEKVKGLAVRSPTEAARLDQQMMKAAQLCETALLQEESLGQGQLCAGMNLARECFESWGLTEGLLARHMDELLRHGALSVKPTGSGGGGYVLSLWQKPPPQQLTGQLIQLN
jgi:mevalonate kinase